MARFRNKVHDNLATTQNCTPELITNLVRNPLFVIEDDAVVSNIPTSNDRNTPRDVLTYFHNPVGDTSLWIA
jgi:hypothetical protein